MKVPPWDIEMATGISKWMNRFKAIRGEPPESVEDIHYLNISLLMLVATSLTRKVDKEDLHKLDRVAKAGLKAMLVELGHETSQPEAPEEAGGSA